MKFPKACDRRLVFPALAAAMLSVLIPLSFVPAVMAQVSTFTDQYGTVTIASTAAPENGDAKVNITYAWDDGLSEKEGGECGYGPATYKNWKITIKALGVTKAVLTGSGGSGATSTRLPAGHYTLLFEYEYFRQWPSCQSGEADGNVYGTRNAGCTFTVEPGEMTAENCQARVSMLDGSATLDGAILARGTLVTTGGVVETAPGARLELRLPDNSVIRIGPGSRLVLDPKYCTRRPDRVSFKLIFGRVWSVITRVAAIGTKFEIETENAANGNRGTSWCTDAGTKDGKPWTRVRVYQHSVVVRNLKGGPEVEVRQGMETIVTGDSAPTTPKKFNVLVPCR
jgi:hypothetical protein